MNCQIRSIVIPYDRLIQVSNLLFNVFAILYHRTASCYIIYGDFVGPATAFFGRKAKKAAAAIDMAPPTPTPMPTPSFHLRSRFPHRSDSEALVFCARFHAQSDWTENWLDDTGFRPLPGWLMRMWLLTPEMLTIASAGESCCRLTAGESWKDRRMESGWNDSEVSDPVISTAQTACRRQTSSFWKGRNDKG